MRQAERERRDSLSAVRNVKLADTAKKGAMVVVVAVVDVVAEVVVGRWRMREKISRSLADYAALQSSLGSWHDVRNVPKNGGE